ncbi:MAG: ParB/RepB/Spo0J family partition protein [Acidisphaera sp.]|nr:ParB/RepB/Spo0J family partition protein [Acidisphaera sp.]
MSAKEASPRLGRGLAALLGEAAAAPDPDVAVRAIGIELLSPGPFQPRRGMDPTTLSELADSIRARGILQPLLTRPDPQTPGHYQIIAGERRWRAAQAAGLHAVPALVRELNDADAMAAALVENLQRQDLNPIEEADGFRRLIDEFGMSQEAIGKAIGKSRSHVANLLRLLNLPPSLQAEVRNGALSAGHARALLAHPDPERAARTVIAQGLSVRQTEALIARRTSTPDRSAASEKDPEAAAVERDLSERLGLRVQISFDGRGGSLRISYQSIEQLDGLIALLSR